MKKSFIVLLLIALCLVGCGSGSTPAPVIDYKMDVPEGFVESPAEGVDLFYSNMEDGSNINMVIDQKDPSFKAITAKALQNAVEDAFKETYGLDVSITENYFTTNKIDGYPAYQYSISYEIWGIPLQQLQVGIDADKTYIFTFTDMTAGDWMDAFEECVKSIDLITEED